MIFSSDNFKSVEANLEFGTINQILLGERGRGRRVISLNCPPNTILKTGINDDYSIGLTKNNRPKIVNKNYTGLTCDGLLLSSHSGYTRRGEGYIQYEEGIASTAKDPTYLTPIANLLAHGFGADGDAGNIGKWGAAVLTVIPEHPIWFFIRYSGIYDTSENMIISWNNGEFKWCREENWFNFLDLLGLEESKTPFKFNDDTNRIEWRIPHIVTIPKL